MAVMKEDPVQLVPREEWWGCFSWANVGIKQELIDAKRKEHVLTDNEWEEKQIFLREQLKKVDNVEVLHM